jgi:hypothetical protein
MHPYAAARRLELAAVAAEMEKQSAETLALLAPGKKLTALAKGRDIHSSSLHQLYLSHFWD